MSWFEKNVTLAVKVACSKIFSSLPKCYTNRGDSSAPLTPVAQEHDWGHVSILPIQWCDQPDATCKPWRNSETSLQYSQAPRSTQKGKYLLISSKVFYFQTFLLQKFKLMFWLQRSQHKAHFLINKWTPFTQAPQKYTKMLSLEQFSWNVFTRVFSTMLVFPGFHTGQISCVLFFQRQSALRGELSLFPIEKVFAVFIFYRNRKIYPFPLRTVRVHGGSHAVRRCVCEMCVWNGTHLKHTTEGFLVCIQIKIRKPAWNPEFHMSNVETVTKIWSNC